MSALSKLKISPDLDLPVDAVTQTFGILAVRGAGKSTTAAVMAEEMSDAGLPFVAVDPVGSWWGLRSSADGKPKGGLPIPIFGGRHGDVPLDRSAGEVLADLVADKRLSCVLDLSEFDSETAKKEFLLAFARRLYRKNEHPLHLFLEEADDYIPQRPMRDETQLLRAWENIVRRGRARGLGITLITQRSASLNKNVLTQVETLFAMRTTGPQDRNAIAEWVKYHGLAQEILESLPGLKNGQAWVWSPHWLGVTKAVQIRQRRTFDSGATPKGLHGRKPATLADVDLGAVQEKMAAAIEKAKADDPKELRKQIAELKKQLHGQRPETKMVPVEVRVEVPVIKNGQLDKAHRLVDRLEKVATAASAVAKELASVIGAKLTAGKPPPPSRPPIQPSRPVPPSKPREAADGGESPQGGLRRMMIALAQRPQGLSAKQLGVRAGMSSSSGTFGTYLGKGRSERWIEGGRDRLVITDTGLAALGSFDPLPSGGDLLAYWLGELGGGAARMLESLAQAHPQALTAEELGERTGMSASSGTFGTYLGKLRTLELISGRREALKASDELFD